MKELVSEEKKGKTTIENYTTSSVKTFAYNVSQMAALAAKAAINDEPVTWNTVGFHCFVSAFHSDGKREAYELNNESMILKKTTETAFSVTIETLKLIKL